MVMRSKWQSLPTEAINPSSLGIDKLPPGEIVDLIASRVKPRTAMWISAGLGDAKSVQEYFDKQGNLTDAGFCHQLDRL